MFSVPQTIPRWWAAAARSRRRGRKDTAARHYRRAARSNIYHRPQPNADPTETALFPPTWRHSGGKHSRQQPADLVRPPAKLSLVDREQKALSWSCTIPWPLPRPGKSPAECQKSTRQPPAETGENEAIRISSHAITPASLTGRSAALIDIHQDFLPCRRYSPFFAIVLVMLYAPGKRCHSGLRQVKLNECELVYHQ